MQTINPEHIKAFLDLINRGPYLNLLSIKVCEMDIGYSKVEVELQNKHMNSFGAIHGGVYSSLIDTAAYWAVYCEIDENVGYTSIDVCVNNLSMVHEGKVIVEGKSIKVGKSLCMAEATAKDSTGKILAYGTSKLMILNGKQSINHALEALQNKSLPPKFLR